MRLQTANPASRVFALATLLASLLLLAHSPTTEGYPLGKAGSDGRPSWFFGHKSSSKRVKNTTLHPSFQQEARHRNAKFYRLRSADHDLPGSGLEKAAMHLKNSAKLVTGLAVHKCKSKCL